MRDYSSKIATGFWISPTGGCKPLVKGLLNSDEMSQNQMIEKFLGILHRKGGSILFNGRRKARPVKVRNKKTGKMVKRGIYSKDAIAFVNPLWIPPVSKIEKTKSKLKRKLARLGYQRRQEGQGAYGVRVWLEKRVAVIVQSSRKKIRRDEDTSIAVNE
jgi:hypothetical protein